MQSDFYSGIHKITSKSLDVFFAWNY